MPKDPKQIQAVAALIAALAGLLWSGIALAALILLWRRVSDLLQRDTVEIEFSGLKLKAGLEVTRKVIEPLFEEIASVVRELGDRERRIFADIRAKLEEPGTYRLPEDFRRSSREQPSELHEALRVLRRLSLIRPREGGNWRAGKHAELTNFARIAVKIAGEDLRNVPKTTV
jgi:hypothetical protein